MCFFVHHEHKFRKRATEDIVCWKVFRPYRDMHYQLVPEKLKSPHQYFDYERGECYYEDSMDWKHNITKHRGLHSYTTVGRARKAADDWGEMMVVRCIIPEGAYYYYNPHDKEYISNYLIIDAKQYWQKQNNK